MTPEELENRLKEVKPYLEAEFAVEKLGYFGSFAVGGYSNDSDVDILVVLRNPLGWKFFDLQPYLENILGCKVDLVTERSIRPNWKHDIMQQVKYI